MSTPTSAELFTPLDDLDPATPGDPFTRLRYAYGQLLGAEDFTAEQRYFLLRSRLHNAALHGYGTVWGLKVDSQPNGTELQLTCAPGLAIDALGREVYVPQKVCLDVTGLAASDFWAGLPLPTGAEGRRRRVYVVLRYRACLGEPAPAIAPPCSGEDAALAPSRVSDGYRLCLEAAAPDLSNLPIRDITLDGHPNPEPRARLLDYLLNATTAPARLWSGLDEAPLLLATVDLEPIGTPPQGMKLSAPVDNSVRALLPPLQALADLALGVHLEANSAAPRCQVHSLSSRGGDGAAAGHTLISIATTRPLLAASLVSGSVRVLAFDSAGGKWLEAPILSQGVSATSLEVTVDADWLAGTPFQVWIAGTGPTALLDADSAPLAGAVGETVPAGVGRDVTLFATHPATS